MAERPISERLFTHLFTGQMNRLTFMMEMGMVLGFSILIYIYIYSGEVIFWYIYIYIYIYFDAVLMCLQQLCIENPAEPNWVPHWAGLNLHGAMRQCACALLNSLVLGSNDLAYCQPPSPVFSAEVGHLPLSPSQIKPCLKTWVKYKLKYRTVLWKRGEFLECCWWKYWETI